jgi:hypothetical protein
LNFFQHQYDSTNQCYFWICSKKYKTERDCKLFPDATEPGEISAEKEVEMQGGAVSALNLIGHVYGEIFLQRMHRKWYIPCHKIA